MAIMEITWPEEQMMLVSSSLKPFSIKKVCRTAPAVKVLTTTQSVLDK